RRAPVDVRPHRTGRGGRAAQGVGAPHRRRRAGGRGPRAGRRPGTVHPDMAVGPGADAATGHRGGHRRGRPGARQGRPARAPRAAYGGAGIVAGWQVDDTEWTQALADGVTQRAIVQHRVRPRPEPMVDPHTRVVTEVGTTWGPFVTPAGYAGATVYTLPLDSGDPLPQGDGK